MAPDSPDQLPTATRGTVRRRSDARSVGEESVKRRKVTSPADETGTPRGPTRRQAACQSCRVRKVKCDKKRPCCALCKTSGLDCEYLGEDNGKITLERATSTILERLSQLQSEVAAVKHATIVKDRIHLPQTQVESSVGSTSQDEPVFEPSRDFLRIPPQRASADTVLQWEIFDGKYSTNVLIGILFNRDDDRQYTPGAPPAHSHEHAYDLPVPLTPPDGELIPALIDKFLQNVHTKNPILDVENLVKHGRQCAESGVGWDAWSCLVLMACALGSVATSFGQQTPEITSWNHVPAAKPEPRSIPSSALLYRRELQQGDTCFTLACRRLGSLKYTMLGAQCYFFAGVYLMYTLRPTQSWHYFFHASIFCQFHLRMTHGLSESFAEVLNAPTDQVVASDRKSRRLEQSLYWSCFKSECEFRVELPLPQSEISLGEHPNLFPSPPSPVATDEQIADNVSSQHSDQAAPRANLSRDLGGALPPERRATTTGEAHELRRHAARLCNEEESWYYYLTEIALRRIGNRIINSFFRQDRHSWLNIKPLLRIAQEFEAQVSSWSAHLPPAMQQYETSSIIRAPHLSFIGGEGPGNHVSRELSWAIDNRLLEMQTWLYQPFLYYLIHAGMPNGPALGATRSPVQTRDSILNPFLSPDSQSTHIQGFDFAAARSPVSGSYLDGEEASILGSLISSGINCCLKTIDVRSRGHRHHGLWFDLRSIMVASIILLAVVKSGQEAWIPGGSKTLWGHVAPPTGYNASFRAPIEGKIAKVLVQFDFWAAESPDLAQYRTLLELLTREVRGF